MRRCVRERPATAAQNGDAMNDRNSDETVAIDKLSGVEDEIRDFVRRDAATMRRAPASESEFVAGNLGSLLQRVSGGSVEEIDRLIEELTALRTTLAYEGERVAREVVEFATLSEAAMRSTKLLADTLGHVRNVPDAPSISE